MKKGLMFGLGFVFVFLFVQTFVFAAEVGPVISNVRTTSFAYFSTVSFSVSSSLQVLSCSIVLNSSNKSVQQILNEVNLSGVSRIKVVNLSESTSYQGKISCMDSEKIYGESPVFSLTTPSKDSSVSISSNYVTNTTTNRTIHSANTTMNRTTLPVNTTKVVPSKEDTSPSANNSSSLVKKAVLGVSAGLGVLLIIGGIVYLVLRSRRN